MSLLLDALRKSEAQRRAGQLPSLELGAGAAGPAAPDGSARGRRAGWALVALVVIAGGAALAWWRPWAPWPPAVEPDSVVETATQVQPTAPGGTPVVVMAPPETNPPQRAVIESPQTSPPPASTAEPATPASPPTSPARAAMQPDPSPRREPETSVEGGEPPPTSEPTVEPTVEPATPPAPKSEAPAANKPSEAVVPAPPEATSSAAGEAEADPNMAGVIRPWELPESLRAEFPDLRLSVHFYASRPGDRFVLLNGERRVEGDRLDGGVTIEQIRKRGLIVGFRQYRILIE